MRLFLWFSNTVTLCFFISVSMLTMWEPQVEAEHLWMATQAWSYKVQVFQCVGSLSCIDLTRTMKSTRQDRCRGPLPLPAKSGKPRCKQSFDHTVRNLHFLSKNSTLFSEKIVDFLGVKNSWKCFGFGLFSCWQLWFHEKNCQKKFGWKIRENVGVLSKLNFWTKIWLFE